MMTSAADSQSFGRPCSRLVQFSSETKGRQQGPFPVPVVEHSKSIKKQTRLLTLQSPH